MTDEEIMTIADDIERNKELDLIAFARAIAAKQREIDAGICMQRAGDSIGQTFATSIRNQK